MDEKICMITPSHAGDIEQFSVLRRSIELFAPGFAHIALINTEDCDEFRDRFRGDTHLQIVSTSDVLPRSTEQRRRKSAPRWSTAKWLRERLIKGLHAQQLVKLYALADCHYEAAAFIDSHVLICRPLAPDYFYVDDRLKLFRRPALNAECLDFDIATHEILGNPLHQITQLYDFIFSPACFRKSSAASLFQQFNRLEGSTWMRRFLAQTRPSGYNLLGYAATVLEGGAGYHLVECNPNDVHHSIRFPEDRVHLTEELERMRIQPKYFVLIQSRLGIHVDQIAGAFDQVAEAHRLSRK